MINFNFYSNILEIGPFYYKMWDLVKHANNPIILQEASLHIRPLNGMETLGKTKRCFDLRFNEDNIFS